MTLVIFHIGLLVINLVKIRLINRFWIVLTGILLYTGSIQAAFVHDPKLDWYTLETPHFLIHFHSEEREIAKQTAEICERIHIQLTDYFKWTPAKQTQVILNDRVDYANGFATPVPRNTMTIFITPDDSLGDDRHGWLEHVLTHEYTHILHIDKAARAPLVMRRIFGRFDLLFPNALQPLWVLEGLATYKETDPANGVGRGQSSLFSMLMRNELDTSLGKGFKPLRQVNLPIVSWPSGNTRYLYGVYFFNFLRDKYGDEKIRSWIDNYSDNLIPFVVNSTARRVFKKDMDALWREFELYLQDIFKPFYKKINQQGLVAGNKVTSDGYLTGHPQLLTNGDLYYIKNDLESQAKLMLLKNKTDTPVEITDVYSQKFDVDLKKGILVAELDAVDDVNILYDLHVIDLKSKEKHRLTTGKRYRFAVWHPLKEQILAVQGQLGNQALHLLDINGGFIESLWQGDDNTIIASPQWAPDGKSIVAAVWRSETQWNIEQFFLQSRTWKTLTSTASIEGEPRFNTDGSSILYVADYNGTYNIYKMSLETQQVDQLTNVSSGITTTTAIGENNYLYYTGTHGTGSDLYKLEGIDPKPIDLSTIPSTTEKTLANAQPSATSEMVDNDKTRDKYAITSYTASDKVAPTAWFPYLFVEEDRTESGISTAGGDPLQRHNYSLIAAYDFSNNWMVGNFNYYYDRFNPTLKLSGSREIDISRADDGSAVRFISNETFTLELLFPFLRRDTQWALHFAVIQDNEKDIKRKAGLSSAGSATDESLGMAVTYNSSKTFHRSISAASGQRIRLVAEDYDNLDSVYTGKAYQIDWRDYFTIYKQHVLASRLAVGWGTEDPRQFQLGGSVDGYLLAPPEYSIDVPTLSVFNKRQYALRGYPRGLDILKGRRMALIEVEWRFPIVSIERTFSAPPVGINRIHGRAFYNAGATWQDQYDADFLRQGVGAEIITEAILGYFIPLQLRVGIAEGLDDGGETQGYLNIGATF